MAHDAFLEDVLPVSDATSIPAKSSRPFNGKLQAVPAKNRVLSCLVALRYMHYRRFRITDEVGAMADKLRLNGVIAALEAVLRALHTRATGG